MVWRDDTIAAIATAIGEGGIGVIRISGEKAPDILKSVFILKSGMEPESFENRKMVYGFIIDKENGGRIIDEVLVVSMAAPNTYTCENVVEIQCHGSVVSVRKILELVLRKGAAPAYPGEFTQRAFLNGRLDLSQAEAVIDLIKAKSEKSFELAVSQLEGGLSRRVREIRKKIEDLLVQVIVNLDFPDEDIEEIEYGKLIESLSLIYDRLERLKSSSDTGRVIREGLKVAIIGKPNVGKSSLMNALLHETRAIVTEIPGTTRDTIEELLTIGEVPVVLTDTAGIRETDDTIEKLGIEKSKISSNKADMIIFIIDASRSLSIEDYEIAEYVKERKAIVLLNKTDLEEKVTTADIENLVPGAQIIRVSLKIGSGLEVLESTIREMVFGGDVAPGDDEIISNVRHKDLLFKAASSISNALDSAKAHEALDFAEFDIRHAWDSLGEITGESVSEDIIDEVFSRFCLCK